MTLFRYEAFTNLSYLGVGILWLLTLVLWRYTPGLLAVAVHSLRSRGRDTGMGYIARFAPINLFRFLVYLVNSLGIGFLSLRLMGLMGALPAGKQDYQGMLLFVGESYKFGFYGGAVTRACTLNLPVEKGRIC